MTLLSATVLTFCILLAACTAPPNAEKYKVDQNLPDSHITFPDKTEVYDTPPEFVKGKAPKFPYAAWLKNQVPSRGFSELSYTIDTEGRVKDIKVIDATHAQFSAAVVHNLRNWRFVPAKKNGKPVEYSVRTRWDIEFQH